MGFLQEQSWSSLSSARIDGIHGVSNYHRHRSIGQWHWPWCSHLFHTILVNLKTNRKNQHCWETIFDFPQDINHQEYQEQTCVMLKLLSHAVIIGTKIWYILIIHFTLANLPVKTNQYIYPPVIKHGNERSTDDFRWKHPFPWDFLAMCD